ncbi:PREDICTED: uncharacterized protein LOC109116227 [Tarenaya hassleriana]|uniref:uncharacterized protein LOC109116227 n=1 Tax=Tarenaya hassleriana TaxID=28532 RepID=UPI0008FD92FE|nr:PREDICTED: uncharacterized protein LOC109116227 [Tarenaya hassleriana]
MVSRAEEAMRVQKQEKKSENHRQITQCNKGKTSRFKRSTSNLDGDGVSSAILILACIASISPTHNHQHSSTL